MIYITLLCLPFVARIMVDSICRHTMLNAIRIGATWIDVPDLHAAVKVAPGELRLWAWEEPIKSNVTGTVYHPNIFDTTAQVTVLRVRGLALLFSASSFEEMEQELVPNGPPWIIDRSKRPFFDKAPRIERPGHYRIAMANQLFVPFRRRHSSPDTEQEVAQRDYSPGCPCWIMRSMALFRRQAVSSFRRERH